MSILQTPTAARKLHTQFQFPAKYAHLDPAVLLASPTPRSSTLADPPGGEKDNGPAAIEVALGYYRRGFSIVPQLPGAKHPCVKWKPYQDRQPSPDELEKWF